jgi:hypothetical protein
MDGEGERGREGKINKTSKSAANQTLEKKIPSDN